MSCQLLQTVQTVQCHAKQYFEGYFRGICQNLFFNLKCEIWTQKSVFLKCVPFLHIKCHFPPHIYVSHLFFPIHLQSLTLNTYLSRTVAVLITGTNNLFICFKPISTNLFLVYTHTHSYTHSHYQDITSFKYCCNPSPWTHPSTRQCYCKRKNCKCIPCHLVLYEEKKEDK